MDPTDLSVPPLGADALASARSRLRLPATLILASQVLGLVIELATLAFRSQILALVQQSMAKSDVKLPPDAMHGNPVLAAIGIAGSLFVIYAMLEMRKARRFPIAVAGAILAMVPVGSLCCFLGLPLGIWALVVLFDAEVRAAFD
jgi:hypothetical protein